MAKRKKKNSKRFIAWLRELETPTQAKPSSLGSTQNPVGGRCQGDHSLHQLLVGEQMEKQHRNTSFQAQSVPFWYEIGQTSLELIKKKNARTKVKVVHMYKSLFSQEITV